MPGRESPTSKPAGRLGRFRLPPGGALLAIAVILVAIAAALRVGPSDEQAVAIVRAPDTTASSEERGSSERAPSEGSDDGDDHQMLTESRHPTSSPAPLPASPAPATEPAITARERLEARAASDLARLSGEGGYTLQLLLACDPANAGRLLDRLGASDDTFVLPWDMNGQPCYRVCWGRFTDERRAREATLPVDLGDRPVPKEIAGVAP